MNSNDIYLLGIGHGTPIFIELAEACFCGNISWND